MSENQIKNIALVGAGGQSGSFIAKALIESGRFNITALTRPDSTNTMPSGLQNVVKVDYNDTSALTTALKGQDCLIITMSVMAPADASRKLIEAAAAAEVAWVLPNEWGSDYLDESVARETLIGSGIVANRKLIADLGKSSYIAFVCSFWYEYSLSAGSWAYGFDFDNKKVTFFDKGETLINTTTWPKVGAGVASLLSLPIRREPGSSSDTGRVLDDFRNKCCYVSSFRVTQKDMFDSLLRVTGDKESDWTISYEDVKQRYADGQKEMAAGSRAGFGKCLYGRLFYPDSPGDFEGRGHGDNKALGLEQEDFDTRTKIALDMWKANGHMRV